MQARVQFSLCWQAEHLNVRPLHALNGGHTVGAGAAFEKEMVKIFNDALPPRIATSASTGFGKDQTLRYLASLRALYAEESAQLSAGAEEQPESIP